ncbi:MAG: GntR family transcriptional regulator [Bacteroidota bacterium]
MAKNFIHIDPRSAVPKYRQIILSIVASIESRNMQVGDKLPSINQLCSDSTIRRDTVMYALNELRSRGIISSQHGKGYYVASRDLSMNERIFMLFDTMDDYAFKIYNSLVPMLPPGARAEICFHHNDPERIRKYLTDHVGYHTSYILSLKGLENYGSLVDRLKGGRVCLIGRPDNGIPEKPCVYHDSGKDLYESLRHLRKYFRKYCRLVYLSRNIPGTAEKTDAFTRFCTEENLDFLICRNPEQLRPALFEAYIIPEDDILTELIMQIRKTDFNIGENIGIITFEDSLMKEVALGGLTTITHDYQELCNRMLEIVQGGKRGQQRIKSRVIQRNSL